MSQTRVTLVRHLPTLWNFQGRIQGKHDTDVAARAIKTKVIAERVRQSLRDQLFGAVWVSELRRTRQTAELLGYDSPSISAQLNELDFGSWEGRYVSDLRAYDGSAWITSPSQVKLGENFDGFVERVRSFSSCLHESGCASTLIIGHGAWIRCFIALVDHNDARQMNRLVLNNGQITERWLVSRKCGA